MSKKEDATQTKIIKQQNSQKLTNMQFKMETENKMKNTIVNQ